MTLEIPERLLLLATGQKLFYNRFMKKISEALIILFILISIGGASYVIYEQISRILWYKNAVLGMYSNYQTLQKQYDDYKQQTKNQKLVTILAQNPDSNVNQIADIVANYAQKIEGAISIYYKNFTTNESIIVDRDQKYYMASLYKIILALYLLDKVNTRALELEEKVGTTSATLELALEKIISVSNNEYAITLADQYGWINIENAMKRKLGIEFSFSKDLAISIKDVGALFEDIALSINISKSDSEYILGLLGNQELRLKLPKYLPSNIYSHNKTGEWEDYSHDAGIFYTPKANYILVFMSKTQNPLQTNEQMALMSKDIYESLNP